MITVWIRWVDKEGEQQMLTFDAPAELQLLLRSMLLHGVAMTTYNTEGLLTHAEWYRRRLGRKPMSVVDLTVTQKGDGSDGVPDVAVVGVRERGRITKP